MTAAPTSFDEITRAARPYPANLLPQGGTALALFAAGFHGWNDVVHMARKEMQVTCVDVDSDKLWQMAHIYPDGWEFRVDDAWGWAHECVIRNTTYDVVSVDPFFDDSTQKVWDSIDLWTSIARQLVTLTVYRDTELAVPTGWETSYFQRGVGKSGNDVGWLVLQRG